MVADWGAVGADVAEPFAMAFAYDSRTCVGDVALACGFGGLG